MHGIQEGEEVRDRSRTVPFPDQILRNVPDLVLIQGDQHSSFPVNPFPYPIAILTTDEGGGPEVMERVQMLTLLPSDEDHILETRSGQEGGPVPFSFQDRIGGDRGAVGKGGH